MAQHNIEFDMSEVNELAQNLLASNSLVRNHVSAAMARSGKDAAKDAQKLLRGQARGRYTKHYPRSITSNAVAGSRGLVVEFGPEAGRRQFWLGRKLEYGTVNNDPLPHLNPAAEKQAKVIQGVLARTVYRALTKGL